jgi:hypothetical protein
MKLFIVALVALVAIALSERVEFVVRVKNAQDSQKLNSAGLKFNMKFSSVLPETKEKRETSEILSELERYHYSFVQSVSEKYNAGIQQFFLAQDYIEAAYFAPKNELPVEKESILAEKAPMNQNTPLWQNRQIYLNKSPNGTDMYYMFDRKGGRGEGVSVVDVEGGWDFQHEDLIQREGRLIYGAQARDPGWTNHGTAVLGEIAAEYNQFGVTGLASKSKVFGASIYNDRGQQESAAKALIAAADFLKSGDIILIELQRGGPRGRFIAVLIYLFNFLDGMVARRFCCYCLCNQERSYCH